MALELDIYPNPPSGVGSSGHMGNELDNELLGFLSSPSGAGFPASIFGGGTVPNTSTAIKTAGLPLPLVIGGLAVLVALVVWKKL